MTSDMTPVYDRAGGGQRSGRQLLQTVLAWIKQHSWVLQPIIAIPAFWPFFSTGLVAGSDTSAAVIRLAMLDHQVQRGVFYPRIVPEFATGLGYPLYSFYSLVSFYLGEMFHLLGLDYANALIATYIALMLIGSFGVYLLARDLFGREQGWAALLAAVVYIYSPYLLLNVYVRGGFPEVGGQAMLPWAIWSVRRLVTAHRPGTYVLIAALSLAALAVSHILTLFLAVPFLVGYIAVVWWQNGHRPSRLAWIAAGVAAGAGISAFFWLPLIVERAYLSDYPFKIAYEQFLPENVWRWKTFLDRHFFFRYVPDIPFKLGIVQLALAVAGILLARRRDAEWLYLILATVVAALSIGAWALPIWLSSPILVSIEFTWRQLVIMSVPLALFAGAIVLRVRRPGYQLALAAAVALLVIVAHRPQLPSPTALALEDPEISLPWIAQFEGRTGALGIGYLQGLLPRWTTGNLYQPTDELPPGEAAVIVERANSLGLEGRVSSPQGEPLRFAAFYFPGWQVLLDGKEVPTYPTTNMGLLTVDVPAGEHALKLVWGGTSIQKWANLLSVLTLLGLIVVTWRYGQRRWLALIPGVLLIGGLFLIFWRPPLVDLQTPAEAVASDQLALLGYRTERIDERSLYIYPYWYVRETPDKALLVRWHLRDSAERSVSSEWSRPFFDSHETSNWPSGTLVDDAYLLTLPADWPEGTYTLTAEILPSALLTNTNQAGQEPIQPPVQSGDYYVATRFANGMRLVAYDIAPDFVDPDSDERKVQLTLFWCGDAPPDPAGTAVDGGSSWWNASEFDVFVHLTDGTAVRQTANRRFVDKQILGRGGLVGSGYEFVIPEEMPAGKAYFEVGLYHAFYPDSPAGDIERIAIVDQAEQAVGDMATLGGLIVGEVPPAEPEQSLPVGATFLDTIQLTDLRVIMDATNNQAEVVLGWLALDRPTQDYTAFVHLIDQEQTIVAQQDQPLGGSSNPTHLWAPNEVVRTSFPLQLPTGVELDNLMLRIGLYDSLTGDRLPILRLTDGQAIAPDETYLLIPFAAGLNP